MLNAARPQRGAGTPAPVSGLAGGGGGGGGEGGGVGGVCRAGNPTETIRTEICTKTDEIRDAEMSEAQSALHWEGTTLLLTHSMCLK